MKNGLKIAAFALLAGVALPAQAQDAPAYTGLRAELRRPTISSAPVSATPPTSRVAAPLVTTPRTKAPRLGAEIGYDIAAGPAVVGVYAGADFGETQILALARPYRFDTGNNYTVGARAGIQTRGVLVYAKAGYSNGELKPVVLTGGSATLFNGFDKNRDGFHVGGGAEFALRGRLYGKLEYTHHRYDRATISTSEEVRFSRNNLTAAIGLRF